MKAPNFGKQLGRFALRKINGKEKTAPLDESLLQELDLASRDMEAMRDCYDGLLSAAAATANSAYEFSLSLGGMGGCLKQRTTLKNDEETGRILSMLRKVQFELQDIVDTYRSHVFLTVTNPSESFLNELRTVEVMKRQCDEKREAYEYMTEQLKGNGRSKSGKEKNPTLQQLQLARDEFNDGATLCIFRLKSLKHGLSRTLLTQAVRHYRAQFELFRKGLESLQTIEPYVRMVADAQHIDYHLSGLGNDVEYGYDDSDDENILEDREFSFNSSATEQRVSGFSLPKYSFEVEEVDLSSIHTPTLESAEAHVSDRNHRAGSYSAPLFMEERYRPAGKFVAMQQARSRDPSTYMLPLPNSSKGSSSHKALPLASSRRPPNCSGNPQSIWHSSPLEQIKNENDSSDSQFQKVNAIRAQTASKGYNSDDLPTKLPLPRLHSPTASNNPNISTQAFSGPLLSKPSLTKPAPQPLTSPKVSSHVSPRRHSSPVITERPFPQPPTSPRVSPRVSPHRHSSPLKTELHKLPRPPQDDPGNKQATFPGLVGHSGPLLARNQDVSATNKHQLPLPTPPPVVPRSLSVPSRNQRETAVHVSKLLESRRVTSPPLSPIRFANIKPVPPLQEATVQAGLT